jgi:hypothetical protein
MRVARLVPLFCLTLLVVAVPAAQARVWCAPFEHWRAGDRLVSIERDRGARPRSEIVVRGRRVPRRVTIARGRLRGCIEVVLTSRGDLAWLVPRRERIVLQRAGGSRRVVARGRWLSGLAVEDDRTLRWRQPPFGDFAYLDLRRPRMAGGCPRRERFRRHLADAGVLVTRADYGAPTPVDGESRSVYRACLQSVGRDVVVAQEVATTAAWDSISLLLPAPPYLVLAHTIGSRYDGCVHGTLSAVDLRSGRSRRSGPLPCEAFPPGGTPVAVTGEGDAVHWTHAGEPRVVELY